MALTLISTHTASADASIDITAGITSTYDSYEFHYVNMHPATDNSYFQFQVNAAGGATGFNETITSTSFHVYHEEDDSSTSLAYNTSHDQAQGTAYQDLALSVGNDNDQAASGVLTLYDPSSTTYVKHFSSTSNSAYVGPFTLQLFIAGYINVTTAIDEISFKFNNGNIDAGTIKMFGVS
jgi:hypothetical protein